MAALPDIQALIQANDLAGAIATVKAAIRKAAAEPDLRFLLFQLASLAGDWTSAANQLSAYSELTGRQSPLPVVFRRLVAAEVEREKVFAGEAAPLIFGEPSPWIAPLVQALEAVARRDFAAAMDLRSRALAQAAPCAGSINGQPFDWLMDGDSRLGPVLEAVVNGSYYWIPLERIRSLSCEPPSQLRDAVWTAGTLKLATGADVPAFIPARYPGVQSWADGSLKMARSTDWDCPVEGCYLGRGQRMLLTQDSEVSLLDLRLLEFTASP